MTPDHHPLPGATGPRFPPARQVALVALGGAVGGLARVLVSDMFPTAPTAFPWATFAENVSGAFLLAALLVLTTRRQSGRAWIRPLIGTGMLGSYTTFATVSLELDRLTAEGAGLLALAYAVATVVTGLAAALAGIVVARALVRERRQPS